MAKTIETIPLQSMSPGTERSLKVHRYGAKGARPKAYLQASLHADEIPGMLAAHHLLTLLDQADTKGEIAGEIIVVPVANPIGASQTLHTNFVGRYDFRSGINFNRRWPDLSQGLEEKVKGKLTQDPQVNVDIVRQALGETIQHLYAIGENATMRQALLNLAYDSDIALDLHCDDEALVHFYTSYAFWPKASDLVAELGAAAVLLCDDSAAASFDESLFIPWLKLHKAVGEKYPIPNPCLAGTVELRGQADVFDDLAASDAAALFRFLKRRGVIKGEALPPAPTFIGDVTGLDCCEIVLAPASGILSYRKKPGDRIKQGDIVADLIDPYADDPAKARTLIRSRSNGLMLTRRAMKAIGAGDGIGMIVSQEKQPNPKGLLLFD